MTKELKRTMRAKFSPDCSQGYLEVSLSYHSAFSFMLSVNLLVTTAVPILSELMINVVCC